LLQSCRLISAANPTNPDEVLHVKSLVCSRKI
jgi:hypothetical protein